MSKRSESDASTDESNKRPRLDINEQIKRAGILATQLRDAATSSGEDTKASVASEIASDELICIFESVQEKTAGTSRIVDSLIAAQIKAKIRDMWKLLRRANGGTQPLGVEIEEHLTSDWSGFFWDEIFRFVKERMKNATSEDRATQIKNLVRIAVRERLLEGVGKKFDGITQNF
ncbi:hypothetical protein AUEXF2481DRAFT_8483 [Aureobasidium subglaciale EXF-2481]|uniref:Uncharacterized protein n=1 Tax=Aureobasidium subglaciale (strain EXF-2481) TaxID=1043005 RepID=A0A074YX12_AURSE|nr:uncharacterized protein AUEXF2481DRAFT_8483 [Aureobasidium subglaciale EXF-2481]KAI5202976.1 hypothetical protein E4T38_05388 [Aureobasidium subglaciale]KAI5221748.1 hypothetical protein E4T40_05321 [Aureobasidium subglaciale]KAI5225795.1 hypothetical protein E4T41_05140 [Aureobasidium subglaciale]KAI5261639.1 hypothetical protein E4T46_05032 [Aureobasidium subglaciale]KEQ91411.1 hypothetical protein AUEXF2481DRAFT_8483 [Aureobasidium subglaciale EXF-2481]